LNASVSSSTFFTANSNPFRERNSFTLVQACQ
jgi:hypothetical protein